MDKLLEQVNKNFPLAKNALAVIESEELLILELSQYIQELIDTDFSKLVNTLYRIDVSETKIKKALQNCQPQESNKVIARLIIEREKQKIKTREEYKKP